MSYILEALKKSEKERQRNTVPDLLSYHDAIAQKPKKRPLWLYLILIALLLNAGLLGWWLVHYQSEKQTVVAHSTTGQQHGSRGEELLSSSPLGSVLKSEPALPKPAEKEQPVQAKTDLQRKAQDDQMPAADSRGLSVGSSSVPSHTPIVSHVPSDTKPGDKSIAAIEDKVYNLNELPVSIKQSLPAFSISVFLYSEDPTSRMVKINGQMMREGQYLTAGLKLEEIIPDGVVLSYKKYRFRVELK